MNQFTTANMQHSILRYKHLTVGDMRPDSTSKLYKRMLKSKGRKYIPVKDVTNDTMGRELNAYLINPEYIDKSVVAPEVISTQLNPRPVVRAIQYSRLGYSRPVVSTYRSAITRIASLFHAALGIGKRAVQSTKKIITKASHIALHAPYRKTYSIKQGMGVHRRYELFAKAGSIAAIASFGIIGLNSMANQQPVQPQPVVATTSTNAEGPITSSGVTNQPIPLFSNPTNTHSNQYNEAIPRSAAASQDTAEVNTDVQVPSASTAAGNQGSQHISAIEQTVVDSSTVSNPVVTTPETTPEPVTSPENTNVITTTVDGVIDTTTQTLDVVDGLVGGLLGQ